VPGGYIQWIEADLYDVTGVGVTPDAPTGNGDTLVCEGRRVIEGDASTYGFVTYLTTLYRLHGTTSTKEHNNITGSGTSKQPARTPVLDKSSESTRSGVPGRGRNSAARS
jgi:hypothetical protein